MSIAELGSGGVDQEDFTRRIEVYLERDLPEIAERRQIAETLGPTLFQYVERAARPARSTLVHKLLPTDAVLFFSAAWDGYRQRYRTTVEEVTRRLARPLIEIDIDDPVGGAIAAHYGVGNVPTVVSTGDGGSAIIGERSPEDLATRLHPTV